jgi:multidrug efflux pump subunit AcrB
VLPEMQRVPGVGQAQLFGTERAMRIWIDPAKLVGFRLSSSRRHAAIAPRTPRSRRAPSATCPTVPGQGIFATVVVKGQLTTSEQFGRIVLRANPTARRCGCGTWRASSSARRTTATQARLNGQPSTGIGVQLSPTGNALATAQAVKPRLDELSRFFPPGVKATIPYDSSRFVDISIRQVVMTLVEAVVLVFLVMFLFLQNIRYTIIPTLVVPIALLGTFAVLLALGFSINVLTMFGMVLVIGIVVDDAIVVVENVERIMSRKACRRCEATARRWADLGRDHRRHRGAGVGVRAAGLLRRLGRQHLPPVLGGDGDARSCSRPSWRCRSRRRCARRCSSRSRPDTTTPSAASSAGSTAASRAPPRATKAGRRPAARTGRYLVIYVAIIARWWCC